MTPRFGALTLALLALTLFPTAARSDDDPELSTETAPTDLSSPPPGSSPPPQESPAPSTPTAEAAAPPRERAPERSSTYTTRGRHGVPQFHYHRPEWGFELAGTSKAFDGNDLLSIAGGTAYAVSFSLEYQPAFIQSLGVLALGPSVALYPITGAALTNSQLDVWSAGGAVRYQARFFREQVLVPTAGYSFERIGYKFASGAKGALTAKGPVFGVYLLLNPFDPSAAADFFVNTGITRSYLVAEYRDLRGDGTDISVKKGTIYVGLRLEL